ncbi:MAG: hypothetical protein V4793_06670 [Paraburkholderia tropica]
MLAIRLTHRHTVATRSAESVLTTAPDWLDEPKNREKKLPSVSETSVPPLDATARIIAALTRAIGPIFVFNSVPCDGLHHH